LAISNYLSLESGRIGADLEVTQRYLSPWLDLIEQGPWADGMGYSVIAQVVERSKPATYSAWTDIDGADDCFPTLDTVPWAFTNRSYNLQTVGLRSPSLCLENLRAAHDIDEQINARVEVLMDNAKEVWIERKRSEHFRLSEHKVVAAVGLPEDDTDWPATEATSQLTIGILNDGFQHLRRDGGLRTGAMGRAEGSPVVTVIADSETIQGLIKNNEDIRQDIRWSDKVAMLVGPWGLTKAYGNFVFMPDDAMPRYNWYGGAYHRVDYYTPDSTTLGNRAEVSAAYENAEFTTSCIFLPNVYKQLNPDPRTKFGKVSYGAQNYRGEFAFDNHYDLQCNPWENTGFWKARFSSASKPLNPRYGFWYIHLRCNDPLDLTACASGSGYISS
jgi:hypothetical protein